MLTPCSSQTFTHTQPLLDQTHKYEGKATSMRERLSTQAFVENLPQTGARLLCYEKKLEHLSVAHSHFILSCAQSPRQPRYTPIGFARANAVGVNGGVPIYSTEPLTIKE
jgi:hypothetical protein